MSKLSVQRIDYNLLYAWLLLGISSHLYGMGGGPKTPMVTTHEESKSNDVETKNAAASSQQEVATQSGFQETSEPLDEHKDVPLDAEPLPEAQDTYISTCSEKTYEQKFDIKITGFVKYDAFIDTRQIENYNLGLLPLVPKNVERDPRGADFNNNPQWNMVVFQSRVHVDVKGPKLGHANTSARIGMDFVDSLDAGLARMRFAYMQFDWEHSKQETAKLIVGHYYHPVSLDEAYPDTLGYSQGILFDPFAYTTQVTYRYTNQEFTIYGSLNADSKFTPARNAVFPSLFLGGHIRFCEDQYIGSGIDFHKEVPRLRTDALVATSGSSYATSNSINSWLWYLFCAFKKNGFQAKMRFSFIENGPRYLMLGGVGARAQGYNSVTDEYCYTNLRCLAYWTEFVYRYKKAEFGVFFGYTKNIGSRHELVTLPSGTADLRLMSMLYDAAKETDYIVKFQPRLKFYLDPILFGIELEYCQAGYGTVNKFGRVQNVKSQQDARIAFALFYSF